jgi:hypothetical protein
MHRSPPSSSGGIFRAWKSTGVCSFECRGFRAAWVCSSWSDTSPLGISCDTPTKRLSIASRKKSPRGSKQRRTATSGRVWSPSPELGLFECFLTFVFLATFVLKLKFRLKSILVLTALFPGLTFAVSLHLIFRRPVINLVYFFLGNGPAQAWTVSNSTQPSPFQIRRPSIHLLRRLRQLPSMYLACLRDISIHRRAVEEVRRGMILALLLEW